MSGSSEKKLVLSSSFDQMERVPPFVEELRSWANLSDDDFNRIMLTLSEAVNNAIVHGNDQDPSKNAYITVSLDNRTLSISVRDEGNGFNPDEIPDPLKEENLLNEGGRGIYLMEQYADDIQFADHGRQVTVTFHLDN
ncbi:ATP-binding protein [Fodinibius halophilus]|uniref:ATP-binding protein n=1 Tax=Fodinibius halophilus TaxID=1736908 RepID=A0A6M1T5I0_9BACT|nr:ATP-binding protein [Fodinibius halophilus]NGP89347.1 ATP-binding protein [Fodinibius halophilus]